MKMTGKDNWNDSSKRAHHNRLERKRRDLIKDSYAALKDAVPVFKDPTIRASRTQILIKAREYIVSTKQENLASSQNHDLRMHNKDLEEAIQILKKASETGVTSAVYDVLRNHNHYCATSKRLMAETEKDDDSDDDSSFKSRKRFKSYAGNN